MKLAEEVAQERWGKLPKTFDLGLTRHDLDYETALGAQRRFLKAKGEGDYSLDEKLPDDFPMPTSPEAKSKIAFQQRVAEYNRVNGTQY